MSAAKLRAYNTLDAMKHDENISKPEKKGQNTLDNVIQNALGKEPFLPLSTSGDSPGHWIQLLHALDQQGSNKISRNLKVENSTEGKDRPNEICNGANSSEMNGVKEYFCSLRANGNYMKGTKNASEQMQSLKIPEAVVTFAQAAAKANGEPEKCIVKVSKADLPGWPLLSPSKVQLQKCSKCSLEFCSAINYRRHIRVHRRTLNIVKDSSKTRSLLAAFWDKLSPDEVEELVSFHDEAVEGVTGSSIIRALSSWVQKPGFSLLPQKYVKAGVTLLDVVHARPSSFPMTSENLFSMLDDASEKTFLIAGTALSLQKYVFDSEAGKYALETKNLVACASFLLEQILVKAWIEDKDAEALRCQKLLVEEEEAAQKRQTELLERKRLKKLRQREHKAKELSDAAKADSEVNLSDSAEGTSSGGSLSPRAQSETDVNISGRSLNQDPMPMEPTGYAEQHAGHQIWCSRPIPAQQHLLQKQNRNASTGFCSCQFPALKSSVITQDGNYRDSKAAMLANRQKVWTWKSKTKSQAEVTNEQSSNGGEVLIGSISVALGGAISQQHSNVLRKDSFPEKVKSDSCGAAVKLWRPVGRQKSCSAASHGNMSDAREIKENGVHTEADKLVSRDVDPSTSSGMDDVCMEKRKDSLEACSGSDLSERRLFSSDVAEAFLSQRWKEAVAADHVKLVLSHECDFNCRKVQSLPLDRSERSVLANAENLMTRIGRFGPNSMCASMPKFRPKHGKSFTLKYVPKK